MNRYGALETARQYMQDYDISADLSEQQQGNLTILIWLTGLLGLLMCAFRANQAKDPTSVPDLAIWLCLAASLSVAEVLRRRKSAALGAWVYIAGLLVVLSQSVIQYGPGSN